jgi:tetratricopeptide (TPR) repeat protein
VNILRQIASVTLLPPLVLVLVGIGVYANSLKGPFIFDDYPAILNNGDILQITPLWQSPETSERPSVNSRPLVRLSLALNYALGGLEVGGYHAVNIAVHIGCALVFYALMLCALGERSVAFCAALLWLVHPLNSQVVNYITQRSESLMALCYLGTLYCVQRRGTGGAGSWSAGAVLCCGLGMASKEVMVTAPVVALLYDRAFVAGSVVGALRARPGLYAGLAATWVLLIALMASAPHGDSVGFGLGVGPQQYLLNQCVVVAGYLGKFLWPDPLLVDYGRPRELALGDVLAQAALLLSMLGGSLWLGWRRPRIGFCALFFFAVLLPTSSVVPVVNEVGADRRVYLPLCGLCALVVAAAARRDGRLLGGLALVAAGALAVLTIGRNQVYQSPVTLWRAEVAALPGNYRAHNNLGLALVGADRMRAAVPHFQRALALEPEFAEAYNNLALALAKLGLAEDATAHYRRALEQSPGYASAHNNLGTVLVAAGDSTGARWHFRKAIELDADFASAYNNLGLLLAGAGDAARAQAYYHRALEANPDYGQAHVNLGLLLEGEGRLEEALEHYRRAVAVAPALIEAHYNLGTALEAVGELVAAERAYRAALALDPDLVVGHYRLGLLAASQGRLVEALVHYRRALELDPALPQVHFHLGRALVRSDSLIQGLSYYREAVALDPDLVEGHYNLGTALLRSGRAAEALPHLRQVVVLQPGLAEARNNLGIALQLVGQSAAAVAEFRRALALRPDYAEARTNLDAALARGDVSR